MRWGVSASTHALAYDMCAPLRLLNRDVEVTESSNHDRIIIFGRNTSQGLSRGLVACEQVIGL
jgi:hypothetical protein